MLLRRRARSRRRDNPNAEMPLLDHLNELRNRLVIITIVLAVAMAVAWFVLYQPVIDTVTRLYCAGVPPNLRGPTQDGGECQLAVLSPTDPLMIRVRVSLVVGLILALPVVAFQLWRFVAPGLRPKEKRYAVPFALATTLLFAAGVTFAAFAIPRAVEFLVTVGGEGLQIFFTAERYLRFVLFMGVAFGLAFEFPLVLVFLSLTGVVTSQGMLRAWRPAVALIIIAAAVITPSGDPVTLFAMAIPLWLFYFAAIAAARFVIEPARARRRVAELDPTEG